MKKYKVIKEFPIKRNGGCGIAKEGNIFTADELRYALLGYHIDYSPQFFINAGFIAEYTPKMYSEEDIEKAFKEMYKLTIGESAANYMFENLKKHLP